MPSNEPDGRIVRSRFAADACRLTAPLTGPLRGNKWAWTTKQWHCNISPLHLTPLYSAGNSAATKGMEFPSNRRSWLMTPTSPLCRWVIHAD